MRGLNPDEVFVLEAPPGTDIAPYEEACHTLRASWRVTFGPLAPDGYPVENTPAGNEALRIHYAIQAALRT